MKRLCAYFDDESLYIIDKYLSKYKGSTANLLRRSLQCLKTVEEAQEKTSWKNISTYIDYLARMEHLIIDIADGKAIFSEIGKGSEKFWKEIYNIGEEHWGEYQDKGLKNLQQILEYVENTNWYKLNVDSENKFTLILTVSESCKFVKTFFEGLLSKYPRKIEIIEEYKKIRIRVI